MRMARMVWAMLAPHSKSPQPEAEHMLFPEDMLDLPDDVDAEERANMLKLLRLGNG